MVVRIGITIPTYLHSQLRYADNFLLYTDKINTLYVPTALLIFLNLKSSVTLTCMLKNFL